MSDEITLYWGSGSPFCWSVLITLAEKDIKYQSKLLEFSKKEHKSEEVLALNPRGQLPTMKIGDLVINESKAACDFLEDKGAPLIPSDRAQRALVLQRKYETSNLVSKVADGVMRYSMSGKADKDVLKERMEAARAELNMWEGYLKQTGAFAAGESFTQADVMFFPFLAVFCRMGLNLDDRYPSLHSYHERLSERASIKSTWPPHWNDGPPKEALKDL